MPDSDSNKNDKSGDLSEVEIQKRLDEAHEKFDRNYVEFKRKKIAEAPCKINFILNIYTNKKKILTENYYLMIDKVFDLHF